MSVRTRVQKGSILGDAEYGSSIDGEARIDPVEWDCRKNIHLGTLHAHDENINQQ